MARTTSRTRRSSRTSGMLIWTSCRQSSIGPRPNATIADVDQKDRLGFLAQDLQHGGVTGKICKKLQARVEALEKPKKPGADQGPAPALLVRRPFMANLPWSDVTYCKYGFAYKKATRLWHNLPWEPEHGPCCASSRCALSRANEGRHPSAAQRGTFRRRGEVVQNCQSQGQLYSASPRRCAGRSLRSSTLAW